jgi:hypothetical protein
MSLRFSWVFCAVVVLSLPLAAHADPAGSSTAAGGGNTSGVDLDLDLSPGRVETRTFEAGVKAGLGTNESRTLQAGARLPVSMLGSSGPEHRNGVLLNPGFQLRLDRHRDGTRTALDVTGFGLYRFHGVTAHTSGPVLQARKDAVYRAKKEINAFFRAHPIPLRREYEDSDAYLERIRPVQELLKHKLKQVLEKEHLTRPAKEAFAGWRDSEAKFDEALQAMVDEIDEGLKTDPDGSGTLNLLSRGTSLVPDPGRDEASSAAEVIFGHAGYRYDNDEALGTRQNGLLLTPLQFAGHAAFRINNLVNVGLCASLRPIEILAGESKSLSRVSSTVEGCADITVGELPTVRNRFGGTLHWDTVDDNEERQDDDSGYRYANTLTVEKKLGPVTPQLGWTYEREALDGEAPISRHLFTVGVAH